MGLTYKKPLSEKTFFATTLAVSSEEQHSHHDYLIRTILPDSVTIRVDSIYPMMGYKFSTTKTSAFISVNHKFNKRS